jgi:hypothetical protein
MQKSMIHGQNVTSEGAEDNGIECSKMGKLMVTMNSKVVGHL